MTFEKFHDNLETAIEELIKDRLNDFSGKMVYRGQTWKIKLKRLKA